MATSTGSFSGPHYLRVAGQMTYFYFPNVVTWARECPPRAGQAAKPGTPKAAGLLWESTFFSSLPAARKRQNVWFAYRADASSRVRHCQVDVLVYHEPDDTTFEGPAITIYECKLTPHPYANHQVHRLLIPVVRKAFGGIPVFGSVVTPGDAPKGPQRAKGESTYPPSHPGSGPSSF